MIERRAESRYLCADLVRLDYSTGEDEHQTVEAVLEDIAGPGACVQVDHPVALGVSVTLWLGDCRFYGHVIYCVSRDDAYFVGIEFASGAGWSSKKVVPRHLTNLRLLG